MPVALSLARGAVFQRAIDVVLAPGSVPFVAFTDIEFPVCRTLTARRVGCTYRFAVEYRHIPFYEERGRVRVTRKSSGLRVLVKPRVEHRVVRVSEIAPQVGVDHTRDGATHQISE